MTSALQRGIGMTSLRTRQRLVNELRGLGISNESVLAFMLDMPRHLFVDEALASRAYENTALPIGFGQTISQPYTVAKMSEILFEGELFAKSESKPTVLEVGTGCGYQTLLLSHMCQKVTSVERITQLHRAARNRLYDLGVRNVSYSLGDGFAGKFMGGPFDGIIAAAVSHDVPAELTDQMKMGGRLVMPLLADRRSNKQHLIVVDKQVSGLKQQIIESASFVPRQSGII